MDSKRRCAHARSERKLIITFDPQVQAEADAIMAGFDVITVTSFLMRLPILTEFISSLHSSFLYQTFKMLSYLLYCCFSSSAFKKHFFLKFISFIRVEEWGGGEHRWEVGRGAAGRWEDEEVQVTSPPSCHNYVCDNVLWLGELVRTLWEQFTSELWWIFS